MGQLQLSSIQKEKVHHVAVCIGISTRGSSVLRCLPRAWTRSPRRMPQGACDYHRYHGRFHGKRSAIEPKCTTITKKLCKPKQVKEEVTKTVETCVEAPKQVCKDVPKHLSQVTCEKIVH